MSSSAVQSVVDVRSGGQTRESPVGHTPKHHVFQLAANRAGDLTAVDAGRVQHHTVDLAIHGDELVQAGFQGRGVYLNLAVADDRAELITYTDHGRVNAVFRIDRSPGSGLDRREPRHRVSKHRTKVFIDSYQRRDNVVIDVCIYIFYVVVDFLDPVFGNLQPFIDKPQLFINLAKQFLFLPRR